MRGLHRLVPDLAAAQGAGGVIDGTGDGAVFAGGRQLPRICAETSARVSVLDAAAASPASGRLPAAGCPA